AEVIFPDADAITGMESPPFGAGLSAGQIEDPELAFAGERATNRFLAALWRACAVARQPTRCLGHRWGKAPEGRAGIGLVPICHDVERAVAEIEWLADKPGIGGVMIPTMWRHPTPSNHPPS